MNELKYSALVLLGACSYGLLSTIIKFAYRDGFSLGEVINGQYFFGWCMLLVLVLVYSRHELGMPFKKWALLTLVGVTAGLTGVFYGISLQTISASVAVVLLFQFTWIGILIEAVAKKRLPGLPKVAAVILLLLGTVLASGAAGATVSATISAFAPRGVIYGILSAITYALFIFVSGEAAADVPALIRSFYMSTGSMVLLLVMFTPSFLYNGSIPGGLWKYGLMLAVLGIVIPIYFFATGIPHLGAGLATILGAAELPTAVLSSVFILNEQVSFLQWVGIALILLGIAAPQLIFKDRPKLEHGQAN